MHGHHQSSQRQRNRPPWHMALAQLKPALPALLPQALLTLVMLLQAQWVAAVLSFAGIVSYLWLHAISTASDGDSPSFSGTNNQAQQNMSIHEVNVDEAHTSDDDGDAIHNTIRLETLLQQRQQAAHPQPALWWQSVVHHWLGSHVAQQHDVALGLTGKAQVFRLDLVNQGPHAMMAGTTGSGKSIMLQSWCLALAWHSPPERLNLVLMDFKGGAGLQRLALLPHSVGCVTDLNVQHAKRALVALERELQRRERLVSHHAVPNVMDIEHPPPRLIIIVDECNAMCHHIPDAMTRLARIASLGRSLAMNLIMCTQNPITQLNAELKANISLRICLRVQDPLQSTEMIGDARASAISPGCAGMGYVNDGASRGSFRCAIITKLDTLIQHVTIASQFFGLQACAPLFTAPLPSQCTTQKEALTAISLQVRDYADIHNQETVSGTASDCFIKVIIGLADNGVRYGLCSLALGNRNIAIIGGPGRGKSTILCNIHYLLSRQNFISVHIIAHTTTITQIDSPTARQIWLIDDADTLLDPIQMHPLHDACMQAIRSANICVIVAFDSPRHFRLQEYCPTRIIFPSGDASVDMMAGISAETLRCFEAQDYRINGRAVLLSSGIEQVIQCSTPYK